DRLGPDLVERHAGEAGRVERAGHGARDGEGWRAGDVDGQAFPTHVLIRTHVRLPCPPRHAGAPWDQAALARALTSSMSSASTCVISDSSACSGSAPACWNTTTPSRIAMIVGMERMANSWASTGSASVSTLAKTMSG